MRSEWVEAVDNIHTYIYHTLKSIRTRRHGTSGSFCAGIEHDVYISVKFVQSDVMLVDRQRARQG